MKAAVMAGAHMVAAAMMADVRGGGTEGGQPILIETVEKGQIGERASSRRRGLYLGEF